MAKKKPATEPVAEPLDFNKLERPNKETKMSDTESLVTLDQNLADYADYVALPNGQYKGTVSKSEKRIGPKGGEFYYVQFLIHPDEYPADYDVANAPEGTTVTYARAQVPDPKNRRSFAAVKKLMVALGQDLKTNVINHGAWEGKEAKLTLKAGEFNGTPTNEVTAIEQID